MIANHFSGAKKLNKFKNANNIAVAGCNDFLCCYTDKRCCFCVCFSQPKMHYKSAEERKKGVCQFVKAYYDTLFHVFKVLQVYRHP